MPHPALDRPSRRHFMEPGDLAPFIEAFATHLYGLGHADFTVDGYRASARHFAVWLDRSDIALDAVDARVVADFADHRCRCRGNRRCGRLSRKYVNRVRRFVHFLAVTGSLILAEPEEAVSTNALVAEFLDWQRRHRGLREQTIMGYGRIRTHPREARLACSGQTAVHRRQTDHAARASPRLCHAHASGDPGYPKGLPVARTCQPAQYGDLFARRSNREAGDPDGDNATEPQKRTVQGSRQARCHASKRRPSAPIMLSDHR